MSNYFKFYINDDFKNVVNIGLAVFIIVTILILTYLKNYIYKDSESYKKYYVGVYHDFVKYILIEFFYIFIETVHTGTISITNSLGRLAGVQVALLIFSAIKYPLGIDPKKM